MDNKKTQANLMTWLRVLEICLGGLGDSGMDNKKTQAKLMIWLSVLENCLEDFQENCDNINQRVTNHLIFITKNDNRGFVHLSNVY